MPCRHCQSPRLYEHQRNRDGSRLVECFDCNRIDAQVLPGRDPVASIAAKQMGIIHAPKGTQVLHGK